MESTVNTKHQISNSAESSDCKNANSNRYYSSLQNLPTNNFFLLQYIFLSYGWPLVPSNASEER